MVVALFAGLRAGVEPQEVLKLELAELAVSLGSFRRASLTCLP